MGNIHRIKMIDIMLLHPHPLHTSVMPPPLRKKLQAQIQSLARYEPLVVRPHPQIANAFQLIHGHQRLIILKNLGHRRAACLLWKLNDLQALSMLACANRLCAKEKAAARLALLRHLHAAIDGNLDRMSPLVPESAATLQKLFAPHLLPNVQHPTPDAPTPLTIFLPAAERDRLHAALRHLHPDHGKALLAAVEFLSGMPQPNSGKIIPLEKSVP